ncbi:MAG: heavy metal translocating P-type ATPase [Desulfovibrio sp.]|nr:heavy metal translocating P-type ATPase [Desulfovibrio sp.]
MSGARRSRAAVPATQDSVAGCPDGYRVVHDIPGRFRLRPIRGIAPACDEEAVKRLLAVIRKNFPGAEVGVSARTGSVLVRYGPAGGPPTVVRPPVPAVRNPIPGKLRSFFYPRVFTFAVACLRAVPYIFSGIKAVLHGRLNLEALDATALIFCLLRRDFKTLASLTFFFALGEYLTEWTRKKSRVSLEKSLALHVDAVWVRRAGVEMSVPYMEVQVGDHVVVRAGSAVPVDGTVLSGEGMINQASMTGESQPVHRSAHASVYAGTVLEEGELVIKATKVGGNTRIHALVRAIEDSETLKAAVQSRYERMADAVVPYNFLAGGLVYAASRDVIRTSSVFLVDYSCALRLLAPLAVLTAVREASDAGVLIKGGKFMEALALADVVVFDKTGTLTEARPTLVDVIPFDGTDADRILRLAACLEEHFVHPVGQAVVRASEKKGLKHKEEHTEVHFVVAHGIASTWQGKKLCLGSRHFICEDNGVRPNAAQQSVIDRETEKGRSVLYLSIDDKLAGILLIEDALRAEAPAVVRALYAGGFKRVIMLTGDGEKTAAAIAAQAGIREFKAHMLPESKAAFIRKLKQDGFTVVMVGDGINDSPALSAAHAGIAMAEGADIAREVADIVLLNGKLEGLLLAEYISHAMLRRIRSGFRTSLLWNSVFMLGGLAGLLSPRVSAFLHNAATAAVAVSSMRPYLRGDETQQPQ